MKLKHDNRILHSASEEQALTFLHVLSHRWRERLQHPPSEGLSRGGPLPELVRGGAEQSGPQLLEGGCASPALRLVHVPVPQPRAQPVQVTRTLSTDVQTEVDVLSSGSSLRTAVGIKRCTSEYQV